MQHDNNIFSYITSFVPLVLSTFVQDLTQLILLILGIISSILSITYTIYRWYKKAHEDGHIDSSELEELGDQLEAEFKNLPKTGGKDKDE